MGCPTTLSPLVLMSCIGVMLSGVSFHHTALNERVACQYLVSKLLHPCLSTRNRLCCMLDHLLTFLNKLSSYYDALFIFFLQGSRFVEKRVYMPYRSVVHRIYLLWKLTIRRVRISKKGIEGRPPSTTPSRGEPRLLRVLDEIAPCQRDPCQCLGDLVGGHALGAEIQHHAFGIVAQAVTIHAILTTIWKDMDRAHGALLPSL